jgi:N-acetylglucosamine-6-phosphate deacetylase
MIGRPDMLALTAERLLTPIDDLPRPLVLIEHGRIVDITSRSERAIPPQARHVDLPGAVLAPGFVDIHIHGAAGHDVMQADVTGLSAIATLLAKHGVTSYFPTTVTASDDVTLGALDALANAIDGAAADVNSAGARPLGIHLEGPFLSHARRGVHPPAELQQPTLARFDGFWQAARGHIKMMTIAPELPGAVEVIAEASRRGVCVSLGHSDADFAATLRGIEAGGRHATHTFNAMRPLGHRDPGILGAVLTDTRVSADIIADGIHLDPAVVRLFLQLKGAEQSVLITDGMAATGMPDGRYRLGPLEVEVKDGRCLSNGSLAGSVLTMDRAVRNVMTFAGWSLANAVRIATLNPAQAAGINDQAGRLVPGAPADILVLSPTGEVLQTILGGRIA